MVGSNIKRLRENKNVTQEDLAAWLGVSRQAISMWEAEKRDLKASTLKKIANVFGVSIDDLLQLEADKSITRKENDMFKKRKTLKKTKTKFQLDAPQATQVSVTGDFKSWDTKGIKMRKNKEGVWNIGLELAPGTYEYKFIVDGEWWTDPSNSNTRVTSEGTVNSVKEINS